MAPSPPRSHSVMRGHREDVTCLGYCAPNLLASGAYDGTICMWNLASGTSRGAKLVHEAIKEESASAPSSPGGGAADGGAKAFVRSEGTHICVEHCTFINLTRARSGGRRGGLSGHRRHPRASCHVAPAPRAELSSLPALTND